ncbi:hypothetical protein, partial [Enterobacter cloacae complex sp. 2DZ2F20B]|uniref:hypothetical protein n=1 Tax=Enterobacter cloacae complex sp. 2DZ2F20B TaxID=2511993 RepID=UPI0013EDC20E
MVYRTLDEDATLDQFRNFNVECRGTVDKIYKYIKLNRGIPIGTKASIESRAHRILGLKAAASRNLMQKEGKGPRGNLVLEENVQSAFNNRLRTSLVVNIKYLDPAQFFEESKAVIIKYV